MPESAQISFRIDPEMREAFRAKLLAQGSDMTKTLNSLVQKFIEDELNKPKKNVFSKDTSQDIKSATLGLDTPAQSPNHIDRLERLLMSMFDATGIANQIALLEMRLVNAISKLEHQAPLQNRADGEVRAETERIYTLETLNGINAIRLQLAAIEQKLANMPDSQQQPDNSVNNQAAAEMLADVKSLIAGQCTVQPEQILGLERKITGQYAEYQELLAQSETRLMNKMEECALQVAALGQDVIDLMKQEYRRPVDSPAASAPPMETSSTNEFRVDEASAQRGKATTKTRKANVTKIPTSAQNTQREKSSEAEQVHPSASSPPVTEDGHVLINGVRKKLLFPKEAIEVAKQHGFKGDHKNFEKLSRPPIKPETYSRYGLGVVPELRGGRGFRKPWYYQL